MRVLADIATGLRLGIAAYIVYAGLQFGRAAFGSVAAAFLGGWILDAVDGHLARAASNPQSSWLGRHDRMIDLVMVVAGLVYLILIEIVPLWAGLAYLLAAGLLLARFRSIALLTLLEAPLVILMLLVAFALEPLWGWLYLIAGLIGAFLDRRRLRVRLCILWEDVRRIRAPEGELAQPYSPGQGE